jgi:hypothetical protein
LATDSRAARLAQRTGACDLISNGYPARRVAHPFIRASWHLRRCCTNTSAPASLTRFCHLQHAGRLHVPCAACVAVGKRARTIHGFQEVKCALPSDVDTER